MVASSKPVVSSPAAGAESQNDFLKYALIAGGATVAAVAVAYVLFGGSGTAGEKKKKKKKEAGNNSNSKSKPVATVVPEPKVSPSKAKVVMEDLPDDEEEVSMLLVSFAPCTLCKLDFEALNGDPGKFAHPTCLVSRLKSI